MLSLPVFYCEQMLCETQSFSPSAAKAADVLKSWQQLPVSLLIKDFQPVSIADLALAHCPNYVAGVFNGEVKNGFDSYDVAVAQSCRYTCGAMLAAAEAAIQNQRVAIAPVSGFHHAHYDHADGFCTFNGLLVTALMLKQRGLATQIAILDLDVHPGDGSTDIINRLNLDGFITHHSLGYATPPVPSHATGYLARLPAVIEQMRHCDIMLYQAGADPHINDPLGGFMTTAELLERDQLVFQCCRRYQLPVAWNLAGGYQRDDSGSIAPILELHDNTLLACTATYLGTDKFR